MTLNWIYPDWPAPKCVKSLVSTRQGGVSCGVYAGLNLGDHVGDQMTDLTKNRALLRAQLPNDPVWIRQVHGTRVVDAGETHGLAEADASVTRQTHRVCAILTADCLPVLLCAQDGSVIGAAHAGWRGLAAGILEQTISAMAHPAGQIMAWLGPAIGPESFEVGDEVQLAFVKDLPESICAFRSLGQGKWLADLYQLARLRLQRAGVTQIFGGGLNTYCDSNRFYSYRRDGVTGRMASLIWIAEK
jgi:YfiH family protein